MCSVQVLYELLKHEPEGASISDDEGHLPIEVAADKACDYPSPVMDLVVQMLHSPSRVAELSGNARGLGWRNQPAWGAPAPTTSGA